MTPTVVVMAKRAVPGRVKTRLTPGLTPEQAAEVHAAMLACAMVRVGMHVRATRHVLALAAGTPGDGDPPALQEWELVEQGEGDLGARLLHVWHAVGGGPVAFFGVDSPDVPAEALRAIAPLLGSHDAAVGPTEDGGYWTLAGTRPLPALLWRIDWGTAAVYDQTRAAGRSAGLSLAELPRWHDVDNRSDLAALRRRLQVADEPPLVRLAAELRRICKDEPR